MNRILKKLAYTMSITLLLAMGTKSYASPKLSMEQAKTIALQNVKGGTIKSGEFEHEMGQDVYSFDIIGTDKKVHEVLVNSNSGKIVSSKIESAAEEAKESSQDHK